MLAEYRDTDFIHIREDGIESVSKNFIPVLFKIELHLQQFHSGKKDVLVQEPRVGPIFRHTENELYASRFSEIPSWDPSI